MRSCKVKSFAKINLDLRVLNKRPDGFHDLRTVFQTISLADTIDITFDKSRRTTIAIDGNIDIPDNLIVRAAEAVCDSGRVTGDIRFRLTKRIPMGAGLGGGSSNAAAVLLALPTLAGAPLDAPKLTQIGAALGSDVPFFLHGGTALGIGRGTEIYPLPDLPACSGLLITPGIHVSTPEAYSALNRGLTTVGVEPDTGKFQALVWGMEGDRLLGRWGEDCANDFESAVFARHPQLKSIREKLRRTGAKPARMTGSGSALFGLFESKEQSAKAADVFSRWSETKDAGQHAISLIGRRRYRTVWWNQLKDHSSGRIWPPQSRYSRP